MPEQVPFFRVFLSSPGDVNDERRAVLEVLERFPNRPAFREKVGFCVGDVAGPEEYDRVLSFFDGELFYDPATRQIRNWRPWLEVRLHVQHG